MKAKQWAEKFKSEPQNLAENLKAFFAEITATARAKLNAKNNSHFIYDNAFREQEQKFLAVCRLVPTLTPSMYPSLLKQYVAPQILAEMEHFRKHGTVVKRPLRKKVA